MACRSSSSQGSGVRGRGSGKRERLTRTISKLDGVQTWEITVENDTVIRAMREGSDSAIVGKDLSIYGFMTIDSLFGFIDAARTIGLTETEWSDAGPADTIYATYDSLGVPTDVMIDYRRMTDDEELGFEVRNLVFETPDD